MNGKPLSEEEIEMIRDMKRHGMTNPEIARELGRSIRTVHRVSYHVLYPRARVEPGVCSLLNKKWYWNIPEKKKPKQHSWFITPSNYPRMWKEEGGDIWQAYTS